MFGRLKHLATFGLSTLSLGLALLAVTPESVQSSSTPGVANAAREWHRPRLWVGTHLVKVPHFEAEVDPAVDLFELVCIHQTPLHCQ